MPSPDKDWIEVLLDYGLNVIYGIAGVFGAIGSMVKQPDLPFFHRFIAIASGFGTAIFMTPLITEIMNFNSTNGISNGIAFVIGSGGFRVVEWTIAAFKNKVNQEK
jgi:hypothetical protein